MVREVKLKIVIVWKGARVAQSVRFWLGNQEAPGSNPRQADLSSVSTAWNIDFQSDERYTNDYYKKKRLEKIRLLMSLKRRSFYTIMQCITL